jgi:hypothetical protein
VARTGKPTGKIVLAFDAAQSQGWEEGTKKGPENWVVTLHVEIASEASLKHQWTFGRSGESASETIVQWRAAAERDVALLLATLLIAAHFVPGNSFRRPVVRWESRAHARTGSLQNAGARRHSQTDQ